jgi:hypothetical protein
MNPLQTTLMCVRAETKQENEVITSNAPQEKHPRN